ncbi:MAG: hypothetical protein HN863_05790 [Marinovum sp.]|jgi:hypothetical protein|nr:hypothetical protein [Marinovum sp.]|tara:strand:- start:910 stop:2955 length:2046 start_codon:yes stop_codon:yes gene_type:complete
MTESVIFSPLLPLPVIGLAALVVVLFTAIALMRGLSGWALRGLGALLVVGALVQPMYQSEDRTPLKDIVVLLIDQSASQTLLDRARITENRTAEIEAALAARPNTQVHRIEVNDGPDDTGSLLMTALSEQLSKLPSERIAGIILLSDGLLHDLELAPELPAPLHLMLSGKKSDWDRRVTVKNAPAFAILDEEITLTLRIEDSGAAPATPVIVPLIISVDGGPPQSYQVPLNQDLSLPITLPHAGRNIIQFETPKVAGELTDRNNSALVQINGVRDRLRVLLVSGQPHAGGRIWRNLLKSDSAVDLVHFTILRSPNKQDGVPVDELSLIPFPTRELFMEKIHDFDLIIFDRYKRRGILPALYLDNVVDYVRNGGAVLVAAGPDFASANSLYRSPLSNILPAEPTARVITKPLRPKLTAVGQKHPVTANLSSDKTEWGRWLRQIEVTQKSGHILMSGADERPLLILDRQGEGRVALLASDHAWLWHRGFEGGGPQRELLRRLAHWMMKEPDLEEETLTARAYGDGLKIIRQSLQDNIAPVTVTSPSGNKSLLNLKQTAPGRFEADLQTDELGLYRLIGDGQSSVVGLGPTAPREFEHTIATAELLKPLITSTGGGVIRMTAALPGLRDVRPGRKAAGRGWIGLTPRKAFETRDITQLALLPPWLVLLLIAGLITAGWLREGRR